MAASRVANKLPSQFGSILLAVVPSLNLNATGDTLVAFADTPTKFRVRAIAMTNGSINPTTARFTVQTAASAGGTAVVTAVTPSLASAAVVQDLSIASTNAFSQSYLYINVGTAQGAAATVDLYIYGDILTA
jgi:hypothetical protein